MKRTFIKLTFLCIAPCVVVFFFVTPMIETITTPLFYPRDNAYRSSCQNHLKEIALAMRGYAQDYDNKLIPTAGNNLPGDEGYGWAGGFQSYIKCLSYGIDGNAHALPCCFRAILNA